MDYEFSIRAAEKELAHLKEMQALYSAHQEAHGRAFDGVGSRPDRIEEILEKLAVAQAVTEQKLASLIDILVRERRNGN